MFEGLGLQEILLITVAFLIFFGPKKIPEMAKGLGKGIREFRNAMKDVHQEITHDAAPVADREQELIKRELELLKKEQELEKARTAPLRLSAPTDGTNAG
jgi:sec-independent protein translocase protein TatA